MSSSPVPSDKMSARAKRELLERLLKQKAAQTNSESRPEDSTRREKHVIPILDRSQKYFPLSSAEQRLWLLDQLDPGNPVYNISVIVRLKGKLNIEALQQSLARIVERHEIFRVNFTQIEGNPVQFLVPDHTLSLSIMDLQDQPFSSRLCKAEELAEEHAQRSFDLTSDVLARANLFQLGEDDFLFQFIVHHIVFDGWSLNIFLQELTSFYIALVKNEQPQLPALPIQYIDFASWETTALNKGVAQEQLEYWKKQLGGQLPILEMPVDQTRPEMRTFHAGRETLDVSPLLTQALATLSRQEGATLYVTLLSAFYALLARYTAQEDIIVGTPIARRSRSEIEKLLGIFINNLALRAEVSATLSFRDLMKRVRRTVLDAFEHQDIPFEKLLQELQIERDTSRTPVFQVFFNLLDVRKGLKLELPEISVETPPPPEVGSLFDLTLYVQNWGDTLRLKLVYNADLFIAERMAELMQQYCQLLEAVVAAPDKSIQEFSLLTPHSKQLLPDPRQSLATNWYGSVQARFTQKAIEYTNRTALMDPLGCWSYNDLETRSNQLAHYLIQNGIQHRDVIAIYARRNASLVWALLGVLKAGAAFLILDPAYPAERLAAYISLAKPRGFINLEQNSDLPEALEAALQSLEKPIASPLHWDGRLFAVLREYSDQNPNLPIEPDDLAYIAFTSGSTGQPKGILGTHRPLSHFFHWHTQTFDFDESDRFSMLSGLAHDPLLRDVFTPLWLGAALLIPDPEKMLAPGYLLAWIKEKQISVMHLTPAIEQLILDSPFDAEEIKLENLRYAFFGGEALSRRHIGALKEIAPSVECVNFYGATETPQAMAYSIIDASSNGLFQGKETIPLGKGIEDVHILVLTPSAQLAGIGEVGEIHVRTPYLSQGYLSDVFLTEQRFLKNPFTQDSADRMYKTGDRGRYLPTGEVEFLGRNDDQIKIRGFRIELGEIESMLRNHSAVKQAVVIGWQGQTTEKRLVAYIVPNEVQFPSTHELKGYLQQCLPSYMIPAHFVLIDTVPLTPNGKVDRRALPEPDMEAIRETDFLVPQTQLQELLAEIWADVLHLEKVSIQDNFFELGGHSLLATQIMSRVRRMIHKELPLRVLFESPTIAAMATEIEALQKESILEIPPLKPYVHDKQPRLSFAQERMWVLYQLAPESAAYNIASSVRIQGEFNPLVVEQTFNMIIERHAVLRTTFDIVNGVPVQIIAPANPIRILLIDLQSFSNDDQDKQVQQLLQTNSRQPFDLANGPLLRILIMKLGEQDHILFVCMHHIASDQWSSGILIREFATIYNAFCANTTPHLKVLPLQYADYAVWQRDWMKGGFLQAELEFWKKQLEGLSVLDLPTDYPRPAVQTTNGSFERLPLSASMINAIRNICRQEQITPFMFFLGIFKILLFRYSGQHDVAVGSPIANRNWFETEPLIGTFVNTIVLRTQLTDNPTFREFLHSIRDISLDAFNHQDLPFEKLIEELHPERDLSHSPLVQVLFNVQNAPVTMPQLYQNPLLTPLWLDTRDAQLDLGLSITTDIVPNMMLTYNTDLFKQETILRMLGHLEMLIQGALADPSQKVLDLQMLTQAEREDQLVAWNHTWSEYDRSLSVHRLVELQAEKTPDAIAVQFKDKQLTYRELNSRANQLAYHLQRLGVTTETPVGISMERSVEMIVGLLGILKAGGTYIPLDPFFPRDRLAYMLEFSETNILLTHEQPRAKETADLLMKEGLVMVNLERGWQLLAQYPAENLSIHVQPDHLAYILFTSGSTGKPKGVQIPHRAVVNFLTSMQQKPGLKATDRLLSVTTLSFDISVLEIFLPLVTGACTVVLPGEAVYDGAALIQYLSTSSINVMQATPATWQMLIDAGWQGDRNLKILCGGEAMSKELAYWLTQHAGSVWNMYGPTETTVWSTICEILPATDVITIGHPIANTRTYILDKNLQPLPVNVTGELYIAGDGVGHGYLKQPELTAEKFLPDPFYSDTLMYRTGDQARFLADGRIDFLGRADFQVKMRGFRIELGEIETILMSHPEIRQAVVIAREDTLGDKRLVAYLLSENHRQVATGELRQFIREKLPEYMVPSAFVFLHEFPMTPNRKVNRKALTAPDPVQESIERNLILPRTRNEAKLVNIWEDLLKTQPIGIKDNFFELGGHSLLAVHMFARIKQEFSVNLPLATLFREATIEYLAQVIQDQSGSETWSSLIEIEPQGNYPPFFCVHGLTGDILWFRDLAKCLAPDYPFYGLQSRGLDGIQLPLERIEEMAAHYINEIRLVQPTGPYYLGGASFGGTVALEMAQQLQAKGEQVAMLAIFDASSKVELDPKASEFSNRLKILYRIIRNFPRWLQEFLNMGPSRMIKRIRRKLRVVQKSKDDVQTTSHSQLAAEDLIDFASELSAHRQKLITCNYQAMKQYVPQPFAGNVTLFRALNRPLLDIFDPEEGWQKLAPGRVTVYDISSSHEGMFKKPHVDDVAKNLKLYLDPTPVNKRT